MTKVSVILKRRGWRLRSGGAAKADEAFEAGVRELDGRIDPRYGEIFLPRNGFEKKWVRKGYIVPEMTPEMMELVDRYHPKPFALDEFTRKMMARNGCQVLGEHLDNPVKAVVCWTEHGAGGGGTGQAVRIAHAYGIPVIDLGSKAWDTASVDVIVAAVEDNIHHAHRHRQPVKPVDAQMSMF